MQPWTQLANAVAAAGDPSPWSHLAAHLLVSMAWEALGRALPKQAALQVTSSAGHLLTHMMADERPGVADGATEGALVMEAA